jgi:deoxyribose-phosphate aldolase
MEYTYTDIAKMIDHSLLRPFYTDAELEQGCELALRYDVASVCIKPYAVKRAAALLAGSAVKATTTVGFPHGGHTTATKLAEAEQALRDGATELDMVINIGKALSGDWDYVCAEIDAVVRVGHAAGALVKVIFENCYLQDAHKIRLCEICGEVGADWVKTSTGYGSSGALMDDLRLMRQHAPAHVQVKAAGGVSTLDLALEVRAIGCTRFGTLQTVEILEECKQRLAAA